MAKTLGLYYLPEGFDTGQSKLMGRHAAGEGFLKGLARWGGLSELYCYTRNQATFDDFRNRYAAFGGDPSATRLVPFEHMQGLEAAGAVFLPGPGIHEYAWPRRRVGQRRFSLVGITHTTASDGVMNAIAQLLTAPIQPWDAVICTSQVVKDTFETAFAAYGDYLARKFGCPPPQMPAQLPIIPLGVDCDQYQNHPGREGYRGQWRNQIGAGAGDIVVLFVGRLSFHAKAHPHPMYVALEQAAKRTGKTIHLVQAGWFANEHIQRAFIEGAQKLAPSVRHHMLDGRKPEVREGIWFAADVFCSLSDNVQETFGLTPIEAMAAGLPQVVSDWNGYKETVRHGVDGFRIPTLAVPAGDGEELSQRYELGADSYDIYCGNACNAAAVDVDAAVEAFVTLIENPALRETMGTAAMQRAREVFDWKAVITAYHALWDDLAQRRRAGVEINAPEPEAGDANPIRQDPFRLFASYPSRVLSADDQLSAVDAPSLLATFHATRQMAMHNFGLRLPLDVAESLLQAILEKPGTAVEALLKPYPPAAHAGIRRALVWFAKVGLVRVTRP